jgi:hypothetical protein
MDSKSYNEDIVENKRPAVIQTLEHYLDFKRWGFKLIYSGKPPRLSPCIIYQSPQCLIRFRWDQNRSYEEPMVYANYGRLHAPFDQNTMIWNGKKCHCWHMINTVINFLDGSDPTDVNNREFRMPKMLHDFYHDFYQLNKGENRSPGEYIAREQAMIWDHYGNRLFDLFDLRQPDLWAKYVNFLKEYYEHKDGQSVFTPDPPFYMVC